jgi:hypothetical protein
MLLPTQRSARDTHGARWSSSPRHHVRQVGELVGRVVRLRGEELDGDLVGT